MAQILPDPAISSTSTGDNPTSEQDTLIVARCLCGQTQETLHVPTTLPAESTTCSCNICRYSTGQLFLTALPLASKPTCIARLRRYDSSSKLSRYFCDRCGSHMFLHTYKHDTWTVCAGVVDRVAGQEPQKALNLQWYRAHEFVGDTIDGGLTLPLLQLGSQLALFFWDGPDEDPIQPVPNKRPVPFAIQPERSAALSNVLPKMSTKLMAACHCGGVSFHVTRPDKSSSGCTSPWPDLIRPDHLHDNSNPENFGWWHRADHTKYLAGTCICRSCRLGAGNPIQSWAFIPKSNIFNIDGSPIDFGRGTLTSFTSSKGVYRNFCAVCGANAFWHCDVRPELIDVSVGLLRAEEGSRAESWLEWWTDRLSFREDALDTVLADTFEKGLHNLKVHS